jgi:type IV secretory pathway VirB2 component (pilin)
MNFNESNDSNRRCRRKHMKSRLTVSGRSQAQRNLFVAMFVGALATLQASATSTMTGGGGGALPWDAPIQTVAQSLTGPVALGVAVVALAVTGMVLVFGGELTDFAKRALYVVMAIAFLVGGTAFMNTLFNFTGAVI